jgi:ornithine racemase
MEDLPYPRLEISLQKIRHNTETLVRMCRKSGIRVAGVTKAFCGNREVASAMVAGEIDALADSRLENLQRYKDFKLPKLLLRLPMISQASEVVEIADISLNSELETIKALSREAILQDRVHRVILMFDLGDLREGIIDPAELLRTAQETTKLAGIRLAGIGTNLTCLGGVIPTQENLSKLVSLKRSIEEHLNTPINIVSGGNSSSLHLLAEGGMPPEINHLRLGESILLGRETAYGRSIHGLYDDSFLLVLEIIEVKEKPSLPIGEIGMDSFGNKPVFVDKGIRIRAICAIGKQDIDPISMLPKDKDIHIEGASSDHLILDVTDSPRRYKVGSLVPFELTYGGILRSMSSAYVRKVIQ